jgi:energy-coupling factor transporter ATP-binding protein EcfA2
MDKITGLIGRDEVVSAVVAEIKKGRHVILTGPTGVGKSAVLRAAIDSLGSKASVVIRVHDNQAKGQFVEIAKQMLELDIVDPESLGLPEKFHGILGSQLDWMEVRNQVSRMSIRDITHSIIPALANALDKPIIAVDDLTTLTPTQMAFWLAIFGHAQVVGCATEKKERVKKLWWKMTEIKVKPLCNDAVREIVNKYITAKGILIESRELYINHVIKQAGGIPQAIHDMLDDSSKEKRIDKNKVRAMRHDAGISYIDFSPVMVLIGAGIMAMRFVGMGTGDKQLYILGGVGAIFFMTIRFFVFKGSGSGR